MPPTARAALRSKKRVGLLIGVFVRRYRRIRSSVSGHPTEADNILFVALEFKHGGTDRRVPATDGSLCLCCQPVRQGDIVRVHPGDPAVSGRFDAGLHGVGHSSVLRQGDSANPGVRGAEFGHDRIEARAQRPVLHDQDLVGRERLVMHTAECPPQVAGRGSAVNGDHYGDRFERFADCGHGAIHPSVRYIPLPGIICAHD